MAVNIYKPADATTLDIVHGIISEIGREVTFYQVISSTTASWDDDPFGPNEGHLSTDTISGYPMTVAVRWKTHGQKRYKPEGQYIEGDCELVVPVSGYNSDIEDMLNNTRYVDVDGKRMSIDKFNYGGSPINRIYVVLVQTEVSDRVG